MPFNPSHVERSVELVSQRGSVKPRDQTIGIGELLTPMPAIHIVACAAVEGPHDCPEDPSFHCSLEKGQLAVTIWQSTGSLIDVALKFSIKPMRGTKWRISDGTRQTIRRLKIGELPIASDSLSDTVRRMFGKSQQPPKYVTKLFTLHNTPELLQGDGVQITLQVVEHPSGDILSETTVEPWFN